jgi:GNAT superfamily N-acetyltransferase
VSHQITIRPAKLEDIPPLNQLIALSVRRLSIGHYTTAQIESALKYVFGVDTQLIVDGTYYVAEMNGMMVGCGGWSKRNTLYGGDQHKDIEDPLLDPEKDAARIRAFFVHPDHSRKGVGSFIINFCEQAARQNNFTRFELGATLPGVPFYRALGYAPVQQVDAILSDGEILEIVKMQKAFR